MSFSRHPQGDNLPPCPQPPDLRQGSRPDLSRPPGIFDVPDRAQPSLSPQGIPDSRAPLDIPLQNEWGAPENTDKDAQEENRGFFADPHGFRQDGQSPPQASPQEDDPVKRRLRLWVSGLIVVFVLWLLASQVFVIRRVNVSGTSAEIWQTVAKAAGLDHSPFFFFVNEDKVRQGVESNRYLIFESMGKILPGTVNIKVIQRRPYAFFTHLGVGYVLSKDGMILEQTRELRDGENLMKVVGLSVPGHQSSGSFIAGIYPTQIEMLLELLEELAIWEFDKEIDTLDIAESLNLTLWTVDGYTINLGNDNQLHAKIGTVASVVSELRRRQMTGGVIEATRPGEATYRAEQ